MLAILALFSGFWSLVASAAAAVLTLLTALPAWAKQLIVLALLLVVVYAWADHQGAARVQAQWDAAQADAIVHNTQVGNDLRVQAEKSVPVPPPNPSPCRVPDPNDRDCAGRLGR